MNKSNFSRSITRQYLAILSSILILGLSSLLHAQDSAPRDARYYVQEARKAYQEKNYQAVVDNMKVALRLRPTHQSYMYFLAAGYALTGEKTRAIALLGEAADMGLVYALDKAADLDSLRDSNEFKEILAKIERNKAPVINSTTAFEVDEKNFIPEGFAYDPVSKTFYLGSVYQKKIVAISKAGQASDFSMPSDGLWSVMGMKVDPKRRLLWVCTMAQPQMLDLKPEDNGKSAVFKYSLATGKLLKRYILPNKPKAHGLGDLLVNSSGDVFASDSVSPAIYVIDHRKDDLELFTEGPPFVNPQGLAFTSDETHLIMADYSLGLFLIDVKTRQQVNLSAPPHTTLLGIDGLYAYQGTLIGVQNGINPNRVVRIILSRDFSKVERLQVLEANNPLFNEPSLGTILGDSFYFIANGQWEAVDQKGQIAADKLTKPLILKMRL
jgi:tetratricopeptide (TPR) repeat protein